MTSTVSKKPTRRLPADTGRETGRKSLKVSDMTADELQTMIAATVENVLTEWLGDPDDGLELRPEIVERIEQQRKEYASGKRGKPLTQVMKEHGIEQSRVPT